MNGTIEDIKKKADIVEIISERITVKKAGKHYKALCPFHGEKSPSFMISPELQIYKCFGCNEGGDVITFLEKFEGMDFNETLQYLSEKTGIKLDPINFKPKKDRELIIEINKLAVLYYQYLLLKHKLGEDALRYLTESRKLTMDTISHFQIGFSPDNPGLMESFFVKKKGIKKADLIKAGLAYEKYGRLVDRFSGRIIFPLFDHRENPLGFSGRIMPNASHDMAKFINTQETPAYHKSQMLFGLNLSKADIKKSDKAIVVEGELDMISPWQRGIKNIVAIKGSALTEDHARLLSRFTKNIVLALDTDFAGNAAAKRGIETAQKMGLRVRVAVLKGFKDPDEAAVSDIKNLEKFIEKAVPVYDYIIDQAFEKYDGGGVEGKVDISKEVVPFISSIEDEIMKAYYVELFSKRLKIPYGSVYSEVEKKKIQKMTERPVEERLNTVSSRREMLEGSLLIQTLMSDPAKIKEFKKYFRSEFIKKIVKAVEESKTKVFDIKSFNDNLSDELKPGFSEMYLLHTALSEDRSSGELKKENTSTIHELEIMDLKESQKDLIGKIKESEQLGDRSKVKELQKKLNELVKVRLNVDEKK